MDDRPQLPHPPAGATGPPTLRQDLAVLGWLATRPTLPGLTRDLLIDSLITTTALAPLPEITAQPEGGTGVDTSQLLYDIDQRLSSHPHHPDDLPTRAALAELHPLLGLARYSLLDPDGARAARARKEQHLDCVTCLRVLETDTAVDLALAEHRRQRGA